MTVTARDIRAAAELLKDQGVRTPTLHSRTLSEIAGCQLWLKFENLQYTASFKDRGAYVKLASLDEAARQAGVIAASAGNHAQGVAYHARRLDIPATIVMPAQTPFNKVRQTEHFGARIVLHGADLAESYDHAVEIAEREGLSIVHPYDDPGDHSRAGHGRPGNARGCAGPRHPGRADRRRRPDQRHGADGEGDKAGHRDRRRRGGALSGDETGTGGQGKSRPAAPRSPKASPSSGRARSRGKLSGSMCRIFCWSPNPNSKSAVLMLLEIEKSVVEGAGAATLAAVLQESARFAGRNVGIVVSGGNIDSRVLSAILMRGLIRQGRLVRLRIDIQDQPGVLGAVSRLIGEAGAISSRSTTSACSTMCR